MRLSTQSYYSRSIAAMLDQQSALSKIQNQVASGKKVSSPADDPIAAVHIMELERSKQEYAQYDKNSSLARNRLSLEESAIADAGTVLQRVRELILQASNTGTLTDEDRESIALRVCDIVIDCSRSRARGHSAAHLLQRNAALNHHVVPLCRGVSRVVHRRVSGQTGPPPLLCRQTPTRRAHV